MYATIFSQYIGSMKFKRCMPLFDKCHLVGGGICTITGSQLHRVKSFEEMHIECKPVLNFVIFLGRGSKALIFIPIIDPNMGNMNVWSFLPRRPYFFQKSKTLLFGPHIVGHAQYKWGDWACAEKVMKINEDFWIK